MTVCVLQGTSCHGDRFHGYSNHCDCNHGRINHFDHYQGYGKHCDSYHGHRNHGHHNHGYCNHGDCNHGDRSTDRSHSTVSSSISLCDVTDAATRLPEGYRASSLPGQVRKVQTSAQTTQPDSNEQLPGLTRISAPGYTLDHTQTECSSRPSTPPNPLRPSTLGSLPLNPLRLSTQGSPSQNPHTHQSRRTPHTPSSPLPPISTCLRGLLLLLLYLSANDQLPVTALEEGFYPDQFDAAVHRPVRVSPAENVCGHGADDTFCKSSSDAGTLTSCWSGGCSLQCPNDLDELPYNEFLFDRVREGDGFGTCVSRKYDDFAPAPSTATLQSFRVHFAGTGNGTCHLRVAPDWMTVFFIQAVRSVSFAMWIRPANSDTASTLFAAATSSSTDVLRLGLTSQLQVFITSQNQPITTRASWRLRADKWTHLAIRIYDETVSVSLNGEFVSPAAYGVKFLPAHQSKAYRIGQGFNGNDYFKGDIQDMRIYTRSVSNREVGEIYSGVLPPTRVLSPCRCPQDQPRLKPSDPTYCVANEGNERPSTEKYRLQRDAYPLEFLNDGKADTAWIGKVGQEETTVTVQLATEYEVLSVKVVFYSPLPQTMTVERWVNDTKVWTPWQYFAHDCPTHFSLPENGPISTEHAVNCRPMVTAGTPSPASNGLVTFDLLTSRPGQNGTALTYALRQFLRAGAVRVVLKGFPFAVLEKGKYHGLYEVVVNARCDCHGHARTCDVSGSEYVCACEPSTYTHGRQCDTCVDGTYRDTTKSEYAANACKPCDCHPDGTRDGDTTCQQMGGQCTCKEHVGRRRCDTCLPGYTGFDPSDPAGCQPCVCNAAGTIQGSSVCDPRDAQCPCKRHVTGVQCARCKDGYFRLEADREDGCLPCGCDPAGVLAGNVSCEQTIGQCYCRPGVTGLKCNSCEEGFYRTDTTGGAACGPCDCDPLGAEGTSCDVITGQCTCKPNVIGRSCDQCKPGYYAQDEADLAENGCSKLCACSENGTLPGKAMGCERLGGQCQCKANTAGRQCDRCKENTYGFDGALSLGCKECDCDVRGSVNGSQKCDVTSGQCPCKVNVKSRRCDVCKEGNYGLKESEPTGCLPCACYLPGTVPGAMCHPTTGRCTCIERAGDPAVTNHKCEPYITGMVPTFGPESGGTRIELRGGFLQFANSVIRVGSVDCPVSKDEGNQTVIVCVTQSLREKEDPLDRLGVPLVVRLTVQGGELGADCPDRFTYLEDPSIHTVSPNRTFLQGGLMLTITGDHLNSVYRPLMIVTMETEEQKNVFESVCKVIAPAIMNCPTPNITVPNDMLGADAGLRRRRDLRHHAQTGDVIHTGDGGHVSGSHGNRVRRAEDGEGQPLNGPSLQFYLGFILDGVTIFRDLRDALPDAAVLRVYLNPEIDRFPDEQLIRMYRPYWWFNDNFINIRGSRLDYAATAADYTVEVGRAKCEELEVNHNLLSCRPPQRQPDPHPDHGGGPDLPAVIVTVGNIKVNVGWMDYEHNFWENLKFRYGILGGLAALLLFIALLICCCCCRRCRQKPQEKPHPHLELNGKGSANNAYISAYNGSQTSYMSPTMELLSLLPERLRGRVEASLVDYKRMEVGKLIGQGHFGRIYLGRLASEDHSSQMPIAIKTLREYHVTPRDVAYFLDEATIMQDLKHEHVLPLLGVVIENNRAYVLLPYMENGDLKTFISNEDNLLTVGELINFGQQVADGMCYLTDHKFVHRDLAARNCMVDKNLVVKIADFGLSRELYETDYYREGEASRPLPVKWMSYESLERGIFTSMSDVWSFGVLLWELMTRGCTPYPDVDCFDMKVYITCGNRMDKPDFAPHDLYELMLLCWQKEAQSRPNFYEIHTRLGEILAGQNVSNTMRTQHERHVRPQSFGRHNTGFTDITREMEY